MSLKYRPDIDGLRAIAVLVVLFFHTNIPGFSGGFVGVDIFFVISGFLITTIILKDIREEKFSIVKFYERRIRRIFPALFPVIAFTLIVGAYLFDSIAFKNLGQSITATTLFSSNIFFWSQAGYFDTPSLQKPLLHTWSLAVEEQFYIFFPLALVVIQRYLKSRFLQWILLAMALSLCASIWGVYHDQSATFYLVPTRAWELLAGSILALGVLPSPSTSWTKNLFSIIGLGLIIYSVGFYNEETFFPGHNAIPPILGSALIIHSNREGTSIVSRVLSTKPLVFIGLISYSLYLWHWPLVVFTKYLMFRTMNGYESAGIILASFLMAILSWKYIETPFRGKAPLFAERKRLFVVASAVMFIASGIGVVIHVQKGMAWRFGLVDNTMKFVNTDNVPPAIVLGNEKAVPSFVLWGDSHATALIPAFIENSTKNNISGYVFSHGSTPALLDIENNLDSETFSKAKWNQKVLEFIIKHNEIRFVLLAGAWDGYNFKENKSLIYKDLIDEPIKNVYADGNEYLIRGMNRTINRLVKEGKRVIVIADVPRFAYPVPRIYSIYKRFPSIIKDTNVFSEEIRLHNNHQKKILDKLEGRPDIIYPGELLCDKDGRCKIIDENKLLYSDTNHLSTAGALYISPVFNEVFKEMAATSHSGAVK